MVNQTLHEGTKDFETLVGFRLDSNGKKIRKQSEWLKLYLSLEDVCEDWKDKYRVAKRKDGTLYLMEEEAVSSLRRTESQKKGKLEDEIADRLNRKWTAEWEIEKEEKQRIYNETHDEEGNLIESESEQQAESTNSDPSDESEKSDESDKSETADTAESEGSSVDDTNSTESDDAVIGKRYFYERRPKLVKKKERAHKSMKDICFFLSERFDEWLHAQQKVVPQGMKEGDKLEDHLEPISFCLEDGLCKEKMFETKPKIFKFKKDLKIPKKPHRTFVPVQEQMQEDYEEEMEEDLDPEEGDVDSESAVEAAEENTVVDKTEL